jgi:putative redox protein
VCALQRLRVATLHLSDFFRNLVSRAITAGNSSGFSRWGEPLTEAKAVWLDNQRFAAESSSSHAIVLDGDKKTANSPMELVLIGLCGCTGYDVASILRKKREPFTSLEVRASAERAPEPPTVYTSIKLTYVVGGKVSRKSVEDAVRLSKEKYCSVSAMLEKTAKITSEIELLNP